MKCEQPVVDTEAVTDTTHSRREYLQTAAAGLTGVPLTPDSDTEPQATTSPETLLIPPTAVPEAFEKHSTSNSGPLIDALQEQDTAFKRANIAGDGYIAGADPQNPEWVLASVAVVCDQLPSQRTIETATKRCVEHCADSYTPELPDSDITVSTTIRPHVIDTRIDLSYDLTYLPESIETTATEFTDLLRVHHHGAALFATIVFGPQNGSRNAETLLTRMSRLQQHRFSKSTSEQ